MPIIKRAILPKDIHNTREKHRREFPLSYFLGNDQSRKNSEGV